MFVRIWWELSTPCSLFSPRPIPLSGTFSLSSVFCLASTMTVGNMESAQLFDAGKKGRGLRATKDLKAGEVVFAEPSYSAVVFDRYVSPGYWVFKQDVLVGTLVLSYRVCHCRSDWHSDFWLEFLNPLWAVTSFVEPQILMTAAMRELSRCHVTYFWIQSPIARTRYYKDSNFKVHFSNWRIKHQSTSHGVMTPCLLNVYVLWYLDHISDY